MVIKDRLIPEKILLLAALLRRVPIRHPKRHLIEQELYRRIAGLRGEREVDKKLERISQTDFYIFRDLRLPIGDHFFQIDTLVLSPCFALIIEAKNISGTLYFDLDKHQLTRKSDDGRIEAFSDPVSQARMHQQQLTKWFKKHKFPQLPIEFLVTISHPKTIIHVTPENHSYAKKICSIAGLTWEIDKLSEKYLAEKINDKELRKLCKMLLKSHTPLSSEILQQYQIDQSELKTGVHCPDCEFLPLTYQAGKWYCPKCGKSYKNAHLEALKDYFLLFHPTISNSQFRRFLHIDSPDIATKMLRMSGLEAIGKGKGRSYQLCEK